MRTPIEIIDQANALSDENVDEVLVLDFLNQGLAEMSLELRCMFPPVVQETLDIPYRVVPTFAFAIPDAPTPKEKARNNRLEAANNVFETVLLNYICFRIKQNDGSQYEWDKFQADFKKGVRVFNAEWRHVLADEFKSEMFEDTEGIPGVHPFGIYDLGGDSPTLNAFRNNGPGSGNQSGVAFDSTNKFGIK